MSKHIMKFTDISGEVIEQLGRGAFLTVKNDEKINTMTIGWGQLGIMWGLPVFVVPVRFSRHTHSMLQKTDRFTVSVPQKSTMTKELAFCGSRSGRDTDKIRALNLTIENSEKIDTPVIGNCRYHFECRILARIPLSESDFSSEHKDRFYKGDDYHELFYGEIITCYMSN
jgi:flavin reductase (DIM6/NTAB) family NADH-FMN oxidoreductase RutF